MSQINNGQMNHLPSMQTLRAFAAAYRLQNYTKAGAELGLTHGAISHRIRELEARGGERLFARQGSKMLPTLAARQLMSRVGPALRALESAFETKARAPRGQALRLTATPGFAARWLVSRLKEFYASHPEIELKLTTSVDLVELGTGGPDAAIRYGLGDWAEVESEQLMAEILFPVCSPSYRTTMDIDKPADLTRCVLLQHSWQPWTHWLEQAGLEDEALIEGPVYSDSDLLLKAAEAGQGVALARGLLAHDELRSGRLIRLFDVEVSDCYAYHLAWSPGDRDRLEIQKFRGWLRETMLASLGAAPSAVGMYDEGRAALKS